MLARPASRGRYTARCSEIAHCYNLQMTPTYESQAEALYRAVFGRWPSPAEAFAVSNRLRETPEFTVLHQFLGSVEFIRNCLGNAKALHLLLIHAARLKLVCSLLPPADDIVDIGGANGCLYDMGYPYPFREMTLVDLPSDARCEMYRGIKMESRTVGHGRISTLFTDMADLSPIPSESTDLVWMGQAIEHISEEKSFRVYREVRRILKPGGHFCLDTPNRNLTEIHTTAWIHPEHKIEYKPEHLRNNLRQADFTIEEEWGLCEMPRTWRTKMFDYTDFFLGAGLSANVEGCYIQYYHCRK